MSAIHSGKNLVLLTGIPETATVNDIRGLYRKEPAAILRPPRIQSIGARAHADYDQVSAVRESIADVRIIREKFLRPTGKALVSFHSPKAARQMVSAANQQTLGGNIIVAEVIPKEPALNPATSLLLQLQQRSPGRIVHLVGLPSHVTSDRLRAILGRPYRLAQDKASISLLNQRTIDSTNRPLVEVGSIVRVSPHGYVSERYETPPQSSSFLIRLETVSDAMRLVRQWHRTVWRSHSQRELQRQLDMQSDSLHEHSEDEEELDTPQPWVRTMTSAGLGDGNSTEKVQSIIDAHILH